MVHRVVLDNVVGFARWLISTIGLHPLTSALLVRAFFEPNKSSFLAVFGAIILEIGLRYTTGAIVFAKNRKRVTEITKLMPRRFLKKIKLREELADVFEKLMSHMHPLPPKLRGRFNSGLFNHKPQVMYFTCTSKDRKVSLPFAVPSAANASLIYLPAGSLSTELEQYIAFHELGHCGVRGLVQDNNTWSWLTVSAIQGAILGYIIIETGNIALPFAVILYLAWCLLHFMFLSHIDAERDADRMAILGLLMLAPISVAETLLLQLFAGPSNGGPVGLLHALERLPWNIKANYRLNSAANFIQQIKEKQIKDKLYFETHMPFTSRQNNISEVWGLLVLLLCYSHRDINYGDIWQWLVVAGVLLTLVAFPLSQTLRWREQHAYNRWAKGFLE